MEFSNLAHTVVARYSDAASGVNPSELDDATSAVFIVDGDITVRNALELLMRTAGWEAESFASAEQFLLHPRSTVPCCLIVDLALPGLSGLELQKRLAGRSELPVIFIASHADVPTTVQAMKAGAVELLIKPVNGGALLHATRTALERSRAVLQRDSEMRLLGTRYSTLSQREREVMSLVVSGLLNKQVGFELGISEPTVKAHRGQVMRKMAADSLPRLVTMATELGLRCGRGH